MSDALPISQVHYELRRTEVLEHVVRQRERSDAAIKKLTGTWSLIRSISLVGALVVVFSQKELAAMLGSLSSVFILGMALLAVWLYAARRVKQKILATGSEYGPAPKWLIKRTFSKRVFKNRDVLPGTASFYEDRLVIEQGNVRFESAYEDDKIDLIVLAPEYLQVIPEQRKDIGDDVFFVPLKSISDNDAVLALLRQQSNFIVA